MSTKFIQTGLIILLISIIIVYNSNYFDFNSMYTNIYNNITKIFKTTKKHKKNIDEFTYKVDSDIQDDNKDKVYTTGYYDRTEDSDYLDEVNDVFDTEGALTEDANNAITDALNNVE